MKFVLRNALSWSRSAARTRVMLPPTVSPPVLARNVVPGCFRVSSSALRKKKSLFLAIGPETQAPSLLKSKVPGLKGRSLALVPTRPWSRNQ